MYYIDDDQAYSDYKEYLLNSSPEKVLIKNNIITTEDHSVTVEDEYKDILEIARSLSECKSELIHGREIEIVENQGYKFITFKGVK